jgi:phosphomannomutase
MVTGSHIPFDRNGIKLYRTEGEISKADESAIQSSVIDLPGRVTLTELSATEAVRPEDIAQARLWAKEHNFDAILSTDGDGDRPLNWG